MFDILLYYYICLWTTFYDLWFWLALGPQYLQGGLLSNVFLITRLLWLVGRFYYIIWMAIVIQTDCPKSVRNHCVNEVFGSVRVLSIARRILCWYKDFRHRTESDLVLFLCMELIVRILILWGYPTIPFDLNLSRFGTSCFKSLQYHVWRRIMIRVQFPKCPYGFILFIWSNLKNGVSIFVEVSF